jgi:hypothetical protein
MFGAHLIDETGAIHKIFLLQPLSYKEFWKTLIHEAQGGSILGSRSALGGAGCLTRKAERQAAMASNEGNRQSIIAQQNILCWAIIFDACYGDMLLCPTKILLLGNKRKPCNCFSATPHSLTPPTTISWRT